MTAMPIPAPTTATTANAASVLKRTHDPAEHVGRRAGAERDHERGDAAEPDRAGREVHDIERHHERQRPLRAGVALEGEPGERHHAGQDAECVERAVSRTGLLGLPAGLAPGHPGEDEQGHGGDERRHPEGPLERLGQQVVLPERAEPTAQPGDPQRHRGHQ